LSAEVIRSEIKSKHYTGLRITCNTRADKLEDLKFLESFTFLEGLAISTVYLYDLSFLNKLTNLRELSLVIPAESIVDLTGLTNLTSLALQWPKKVVGLELCVNISKLILIDLSEKDMHKVSSLVGVKKLEVKTSKLKSLAGAEKFSKVEEVKIGYSRSLETIMQLNGHLELKVLELESTPKVMDLESLNNLPNLQVLRLINCGSINSLSFVKSFPSLKRFALLENTVVADGNLTPVNHITEFFFKNYKHYFGYTQKSVQDDIIERNMKKLKR
jgi:Leucine-rich repeat (LRR) protein